MRANHPDCGRLPIQVALAQRALHIQAYGPNLKGCCLDVSERIVQALAAEGMTAAIQFGLFNGQRHAWVDVWTEGRVWVLDATADQFGEQWSPVIFGRMPDLPEYGRDPELG